MKYLRYVDGLRAIAVAAVIAFHVAPSVVPGGYAGVDVFFVISGFLITRLIFGEIDERRFTILGFWGRRARRLLPAAVVCFVTIALLGYFVLLPDAYRDFGASLGAASLMYANLYFRKRTGYFDAPPDELPLLHTWSLSVEDQFYLVWPLLLLALLPVVSRRVLAVLIVVAAALSFAWAESQFALRPANAFFLIQARAGELLIGALAALLADRARFSRLACELAAAAGLLVVFASFFVLGPETRFPGLNALPVCAATALVIIAGYHRQTWATRALSLGPVVFVGLISYSLYLWHWPLLVLSRYALERPLTVPEAGAVVLAAVVIATLSWKYVEQPFRHRAIGLPFDARSLLRTAALPMVLLALFGASIRYGDGWPWRYEAEARELFKQASSGNPLREACDGFENAFRNDLSCNFGRRVAQNEDYDIVVIGDSMADHWVPAVAAYATRVGLAGRQVTNGGCPALLVDVVVNPSEFEDRMCRSYRQALAKFLDANPDIKLVIVSGYWSKWLRRIDKAGGEGRFESALHDTLQALKSRGAVVLVIDEVPTYGTLPMRCVANSLSENVDVGRCGLPAEAARRQSAASFEILTRLTSHETGVYFTTPRSFLCEKATCDLIEERVFLYRDQAHLSGIGARALGHQINWPDLPPASKRSGDAPAPMLLR